MSFSRFSAFLLCFLKAIKVPQSYKSYNMLIKLINYTM